MKRTLHTIESDLERAEEEARIARDRLEKLKDEQNKNDDFRRRQEFKQGLNDPYLYKQLFEGPDALINLNTVSLETAKKTVEALTAWKDKAVKVALEAQSRRTRTIVKSEEIIDHDPYDGRPYKSILYTYSDGTSDMSYIGGM